MPTNITPQPLRVDRRKLLAGAVGLGLGAAVLRGAGSPAPAQAAAAPKHLAWVWQFSTDGEPNIVGARLLENGLGIVLKSHDGLHWMSEYDKSAYAVSGPAQLAVLANYYESAGVPFHAWCVVHGDDPLKEAKMASDVLNAGARSIYLDIEPHSGFWRGTPADAVAFGKELRRLSPNGVVSLSIDPRPWMVVKLPMKELTSFANSMSPQQYWRTFNTQANYEKFQESGYAVPPGGITPEYLFAISDAILPQFGLPLEHVGQGATPDAGEWRRFLSLSFARGSTTATVWRYGVTPPDVLRVLREVPPPVPVQPAPVALTSGGATQGGVYTVRSGDTLSAIAASQGVSMQAIVDANALANADYLYVGQQLTIPGASGGDTIHAAAASVSGPAPSEAAARSHTVQTGDTLYGIAGRFGTTVDSIVQANGLSNPDLLSVGQILKIL